MVKTYPFAEIHMNRVNQDMQVVGRATVNRRKKQITVIFDDFYKNWKGPEPKEVPNEQPTKKVTKRRSR